MVPKLFSRKLERITFHVMLDVENQHYKTRKDSVVIAPFRNLNEALYNFAGESFLKSKRSESKFLTTVLSKAVEEINLKENVSVCCEGRWKNLHREPLGILLNLDVLDKVILRERLERFLRDNHMRYLLTHGSEAFEKNFAYGYLVAKFLRKFLQILDSEPSNFKKFKQPISISFHGPECVPALLLLKEKDLMRCVRTTYVIDSPVLGDWIPRNPKDVKLRVRERGIGAMYKLELLGAEQADAVANVSAVPDETVHMQVKKYLHSYGPQTW